MRIVDGEGNTAWVSAAKQKSLYTPEEASPELPFTFLGYAPRGNVTVSGVSLTPLTRLGEWSQVYQHVSDKVLLTKDRELSYISIMIKAIHSQP